MAAENLGDAFRRAVAGVRSDAELLGIPLSKLCDDAGVSRTTPYRYENGELPTTIQTVVKLQDEIQKHRASTK